APDQGPETSAPAGNAADTSANGPAGTDPSTTKPTDGKPSGDGMDTDGHGWNMQGTTVALHGGPATFKAGGGWSEFTLSVDNRHGRSFNGLVLLPIARGVKIGGFQLQFRGPDGAWHDARAYQQSDDVDLHFIDEHGSDHLYKVDTGDVLTVDLRARFTLDTATVHGSFGVSTMAVGKGDAGGYKWSNTYEFTVLPADKKPSTQGGTHPSTGHDAKPSKGVGPKPSAGGGTKPSTGSVVTPAVAKGGNPDGGTGTSQIGTSGAASDLGTSGAAPSTSGDGAQLAETGANPAMPWAVGGSAVALTAGAGLVLAARRRPAADS
ncbi:LAETG motif-containing sortase-dependent surface protein, partial [Streptomyces sp. NPDC054933]